MSHLPARPDSSESKPPVEDSEPGRRPAASSARGGARHARTWITPLTEVLAGKWGSLRHDRVLTGQLEQHARIRTAILQHAQPDLCAEIGRRAQIERELKLAKDAAESSSRAKSDFLAYLSHELRTQVNGIVNVSTLLHEMSLDPEPAKLVQLLHQTSESLLAILNDVLDLSKIEADHLALEHIDFDFAEQLQFATRLYADAAENKGLLFIVDIDPTVPAWLHGDPLRLRQIVGNLLNNAVKFTTDGQIVLVVRLDRALPGRSRLRFEISDTGIGISDSVQASLFQPFVQAESSTSRRFGGSGLGLAICKRLVELMHGDIGVKSVEGMGSTFWFTAELAHVAAPDSGHV